ncbi:unnamed protein product, partial [Gongylonema pulchrum]|uniref:Mediator complex subunit 11 n=1 Tax=Gongylonema pulchrum TaxID=637853 RepID=A0A183DG35_9BILA
MKTQEADQKSRENEQLGVSSIPCSGHFTESCRLVLLIARGAFQDELSKKNVKIVELTAELETLRESCVAQKKRITDAMQTMLRDLSEVGSNYANAAKFNMENGTDKPYDEELFAHARICISKLSADFKSTLQKVSNLESGSGDVAQRLEATEKDLADCRLQLQQNEAK